VLLDAISDALREWMRFGPCNATVLMWINVCRIGLS